MGTETNQDVPEKLWFAMNLFSRGPIFTGSPNLLDVIAPILLEPAVVRIRSQSPYLAKLRPRSVPHLHT